MSQFSIKQWHFNPINVACLVMLTITMTAVLMSGKSADKAELPEAVPVAKEITVPNHNPVVMPNPFGGIEAPIDWIITKDYQIQIMEHGKYAVLFDRERVVAVLPLDNRCNLTNAIMRDQD